MKSNDKIDISRIKGISVKKSENFSEWYSEVVQKCELADLRSDIKGCLVFQPWSVLSMEKMYKYYEEVLQRKGHFPYFFPTLIPEENLTKESQHIEGFSPEAFWVTHGGNEKFEKKYALRPTSETIIYPMFNLWIRSWKDLPFKTYQRANVFRYETKATRPFLRSREFYWIESHCAHETKEDGMEQVHENMETTQEVLHDIFGLPFIFFERPAWDKFPGAERTFAADVLNPDGRVVQQPSNHLLKQEFSKAFNVKFTDKNENEKFVWLTCYGPAISRIFASIIITHGDDKGLRFPWRIAPKQIVIVPIRDDEKINKKVKELEKKLSEKFFVFSDYSDKTPGEKFNHWEMKGVPLRIEIGFRDIENKTLTIFRRDTNTKEVVSEKNFFKKLDSIIDEYDKNLLKEADKILENRIKETSDKEKIKSMLESGNIVKCNFCSVDKEGSTCAEKIEKEMGATVRGTKLVKENAKGNCIMCGKKAKEVVYIARQY